MYRILIAEDQSLIRKGIISVIEWENLGCALVGEAANGQEAIRLIRELKPDILLTDIKMPYVDGLKLMDYIRDNDLPTKTIVISGYDDFIYVRHALNAASVDYILKPIDAAELNRAIHRAIQLLEKEDSESAKSVPAFDFSDALQPSSGVTFSDLFKGESGSFFLVCAWNRYHDYQRLSEKLASSLPRDTAVQCAWTTATAVIAINFRSLKPAQARILVEKALSTPAAADQYWGVSEPRDVLSSVAGCYSEAINILCLKLLHPEKRVFWAHRKEPVNWTLPIDEAPLLDLIFAGNAPAALSAVRSGIQSLRAHHPDSFEAVKLTMMCVYSALLRADTACGSEINEQITLLSSPEYILELENIPLLLQPLEQLIQKVCGFFQQRSHGNDIPKMVLSYIDHHYTESLSLTKLGEIFHINPNYLSSLFKQKTGVGINRYITSLRLNYACMLLRTTDLPISEISERAGFTNYIHFSKIFKNSVGTPPGEYRKLNQH